MAKLIGLEIRVEGRTWQGDLVRQEMMVVPLDLEIPLPFCDSYNGSITLDMTVHASDGDHNGSLDVPLRVSDREMGGKLDSREAALILERAIQAHPSR